MRCLSGQQEKEARNWINRAIKIAQKATCMRAKCGAVIVNANEIIGYGFNSPPGDDEEQRRCDIEKSSYNQKVTDKTCCVHAEQRAIMEALSKNPTKVRGAKMYFARFNSSGERILMGGEIKMYCTICTKMILDVGIIEFILEHKDGIYTRTASESNQESFNYKK